MNNGKISTIIFDWSGVLSNDFKAVFETTNDIIELKGHARISMKKFRQINELPWINTYKKLGLEISHEEDLKLFEKFFPKYFPKTKAFPKAKQTLEWIKKQGIKTIVFSAHNEKLVEKEMQNYGFDGLISEANGSVFDKKKKILELIEKNKAKKENTIYVGDTVHDIETAQFAGIKSIAVLQGYDSKEKLEKEKPDFIIKKIGELPKLIEKINCEK